MPQNTSINMLYSIEIADQTYKVNNTWTSFTDRLGM